MSTLKKYNLQGKATGSITVDKALTDVEVNSQMVKDYIVAIRANQRQWSASTKTRAEVSHTTKKSHAQKGTGRARHSSLVAPQFKGGGIVFGPRPKFNQRMKVNKKEKRAAVRFLIAEKIKNDKVKVVESTEMEAPKTKVMANFISAIKCTGRTLFLADQAPEANSKTDAHTNLQKSLKNLQKTNFLLATNISGYDLMRANELIITETGLKQLTEWLTKEGE